MERKSNDGFSYTYSASEQAEIRSIREKYTEKPREESSMERLRRLDARPTQRAQTVSLILGVVGVLILGIGMSLIMSEFGEILGAYRHLALPVGILIGGVGGALVALAYPVYHWILKRERRKVAPEILRLTDLLMK